MDDEKRWEGVRLGTDLIGPRYDAVGPELGHLHDAKDEATGKPCLMFILGDGVDWAPTGTWEVKITCLSGPTRVRMEVQVAPGAADIVQLANVFTVSTAALQRVEDHPRVRAQLLGPPRELARRDDSRRWVFFRKALTFTGLALFALCGCVWMHTATAESREGSAQRLRDRAPVKAAIAYRLPSKPFIDQAAAPCVPALGEVEINGGCWMELAQRSPCIVASQAEHQGKCYLPVSKERPLRPPTSVEL